jgi:hypothetical protein
MTAKPRGKGKEQVKKLKLKKETIRDLDVKRTAKKVKGGWVVEYPSALPGTCSRTINCACTMENTCGCTVTCLYTCPCRK